jgi:hypothetical protein
MSSYLCPVGLIAASECSPFELNFNILLPYSLQKIRSLPERPSEATLLYIWELCYRRGWTNSMHPNGTRSHVNRLNICPYWCLTIILQGPLSLFSSNYIFSSLILMISRLCSLAVRVSGWRTRGLRFGPRRYQNLWAAVGPDRDTLRLIRIYEELLERKNSSSGLENWD